MSKNLKAQFHYVIENNFKPGMDKHSMKHQDYKSEVRGTKIFSYSDRQNLINTSAHLANWLKEAHPEVKMVRDIRSKHIQEYLNKNSVGWTKATVELRMSHLRKLETLANNTFKGSEVKFTHDLVKPAGNDPTRIMPMSRSDYNRLLVAMKDSESAGKTAFELAGRFGLRVSETTKLQYRDITEKEDGTMNLHIHNSKGGHSRDIQVGKPADIQYLKELVVGHQGDSIDRVVPIQDDSVNKFINRTMEKAGIDEYRDASTSIHALRKMVAQELYDELRLEGKGRNEALDEVSKFLGHGKDREACISRYVSNIY